VRKGHVSGVSHGQGGICSDVNKDWTCKDKDQAYKDQDKDNEHKVKVHNI